MLRLAYTSYTIFITRVLANIAIFIIKMTLPILYILRTLYILNPTLLLLLLTKILLTLGLSTNSSKGPLYLY